jgi:hypothetical protein
MTNGTESQPPETGATQSASRSHWTAGRVIGMVFASIGGLIGLALLLGGIAVVIAYAFERDDDGYWNTDRHRLESATYAITTQNIDLGADAIDWAPKGVLGKVRIQVDSRRPVFVGIGPDNRVDQYLGSVSHDQLVDFSGHPQFELHQGKAPATPPAKQGFWVAQAQGSGQQALTWDADFGRWTAVVMNANGARGINVNADVGVKLDWAIWAGLGLLLLGALMTAGAVAVILLIGRRAVPAPADPEPTAGPG